MNKHTILFLLTFLAVSLFICNIYFISAESDLPQTASEWWNIFKDPAGNDSGVALISKVLMLVLVIILIYSSMSLAKFPQNSGLRFLISLIVGILAIILINNSEIMAIMQSYKALGVSISLFVPLIVLCFITYAVAVSLSTFGILLQRVAWLIYGVFLLFKVGGLLIFRYFEVYVQNSEFVRDMANFLFGTNDITSVARGMDTTILMVMVMVAVVVMIWFVIFNESTVKWIQRVLAVADLDRYRDNANRSSEKQKVDAEQTKKS